MQINESSDALRIIKAISASSSLAVVEAHAEQPLSLRLEPGQEVRGQVIASLVNGRFLVKVSGSLLDMNLPATTQLGESVQLTFLAEKPRLTFSLSRLDNSSTPVSLSEAGRWLTLLSRLPTGEALPREEIYRAIQSAVKDAVFVEAKGEGAAALARTMTPGKQVTAEVVATLPDGRTQVRVAGQLVEMNLPKAPRTGTELQLMFVSDEPEVVFTMPEKPHRANTAVIAEMSRWLRFASRTAEAPLLPSPTPLLAAAPESAEDLATTPLPARLREALTQSGVFYESHVTRWAEGKIKVEELLHEPQGRLSPHKHAVVASGPAAPEGMPAEHTAPATPTSEAMTTQLPQSTELADNQTLPVVRQQLALLHTGQFVWQGEAWSGQPMEWKVEERDPEPEDGPGRQWQTALSLELPRLGNVRAEIRLKDGAVSIAIQVDNEETRTLMESHDEKLRERLTAGGLNLSQVVITNEE